MSSLFFTHQRSALCADIPSPYKLEAPWDAFEFGFHVLKAQANVVIMTMAWQTHQDHASFNSTTQEPDLETLVYWVQRLEPLIRAGHEEETIVVFCNRTGAEGEATYTGTSAVLGIKRGEVYVYGVLGRGVNDLLVVDTSQPPRSKLTDADAVDGDEHVPEKISLDTEVAARPAHSVFDNISTDESEICQCHLADAGVELAFGSPRSATSARLPWLAQTTQPGETPTDSRSPTRLQIPTRPQYDDFLPIDSAITDDVIIDTPALPDTPAFARRAFRPKLATPRSPRRFPSKGASPYPWSHHDGPPSAVFGAGATMTPITPFDEDGWSSTPIDPKGPPQWFWRHEPTLSALRESVVEEEEEQEDDEEEKKPIESSQSRPVPFAQEEKPEPLPVETAFAGPAPADPLPAELQETHDNELGGQPTEQEADASGTLAPEEPESAPLSQDWADLAQVLEGLRVRPGSAIDLRSSHDDRPCSPKSRYLSRDTSPIRLFQPSELDYDDWEPTGPEAGAYQSTFFSISDRPSSRTGHRSIQRSSSFDRPSRSGIGGRADRRPSRLRHAIFFPDDADTEPDNDYSYDPEPVSVPKSEREPEPWGTTFRGRQPNRPHEPPMALLSDDPSPTQSHPSPSQHHHLSTLPANDPQPSPHQTISPPAPQSTLDAADVNADSPLSITLPTALTASSTTSSILESTTTTTITTPSLCSTTSAASTTSATSVSAFSDGGSHYHHHHHHLLLGYPEGGAEGEVGLKGNPGHERERVSFVLLDGTVTAVKGAEPAAVGGGFSAFGGGTEGGNAKGGLDLDLGEEEVWLRMDGGV